jgi:hypothetical protein
MTGAVRSAPFLHLSLARTLFHGKRDLLSQTGRAHSGANARGLVQARTAVESAPTFKRRSRNSPEEEGFRRKYASNMLRSILDSAIEAVSTVGAISKKNLRRIDYFASKATAIIEWQKQAPASRNPRATAEVHEKGSSAASLLLSPLEVVAGPRKD